MNDGAALGLVLDQVSKDKNIDRKRAGRDAGAGDPDRRQARLRHAPRDGGEVQRGDRPRRPVPDHRQRRCRTVTRAGQRDDPRRRAASFGLEAERGRRAAVPDLLRREGSGQGRGAGREVRRRCSSSTAPGRASAASPRRPPSRSSASACARPSARTSSTSTRTARASSSPASCAASSAATSSSTSAAPRRCCRCASRCRASRTAPATASWPTCVDIDQQRARPADHPVAHAQGPAREAVRDGGPGDLREDRAHRGVAPASRARASKIAVSARAIATSIRSAPASA